MPDDNERKNFEPLPNLQRLHTGLGSLCLLHGQEIIHDGDGSHSFVIQGHAALIAEGIKEIAYVAPFEDYEGTELGNTVHITFEDDQLDRGMSIWALEGKYGAQSYADPKTQMSNAEIDQLLPDEGKFAEAARLLLKGLVSEDPEIKSMQDKLFVYLSIQDSSPNPEEIIHVMEAYRGLRASYS
ncbi:MAG: hypothetical protein WBB39_05240 [Candidatus Saccharimonadales bacterium]